jgi:hypothetical protein
MHSVQYYGTALNYNYYQQSGAQQIHMLYTTQIWRTQTGELPI